MSRDRSTLDLKAVIQTMVSLCELALRNHINVLRQVVADGLLCNATAGFDDNMGKLSLDRLGILLQLGGLVVVEHYDLKKDTATQ